MNHLNHCLVCHDPNHFDMKVREAKRISRNIEVILSKYGDAYSLEMYEKDGMRHNFDFDHQHQHFMCGHCYKVNTMSLRNAEDDIVDNLLKFVMLVKTDKEKVSDSDYHSILRNLAGHYPGMYRNLEREWHKVDKE